MNNLDKILEGLLFLSGDGLDRGIIMEKLQITPKQLDKAVEILKERYNEDCGINMITYKDKLQLCASPKYADDVSLVLNPIRERQLTKATLEVMAIIAYKQPVTRLDVQEIRGINSDYAIQTLLNYKLIEVIGRKDAVGKPLLFGTTDEFLRHFGINSIDELPDYNELMKDIEKIQLENNHLYHEFEIPDENIEDKIDISVLEAEEMADSSTSIDKHNSKIDELPDIELEKIASGEEEFDLTKLSENNFEQIKDEFEDKSTKKKDSINQDNEINYEDSPESDGIDWSLLEDNPDIGIEE